MVSSYDHPDRVLPGSQRLFDGPQPSPGASARNRNGDYGVGATFTDGPYSGDGRKYNKRARSGAPDYERLFSAMRASRRVLYRYRTERFHAVKQFVGNHYSDGGTERQVPLNLIARYVQIVSRSLVPKCPRVMMSTDRRENQPAVRAMQDWLNARLVSMHFDQTLHRWVQNALFGLSVMKVALAAPLDAAANGYVSPAGVPFAEIVDLDDFVFDVGTKDLSRASFVGHRYRVPLDVAREIKDFDKRARGALVATSSDASEGRTNAEGDDRIGTIGQGWEGGADERDFEPMVDLWEVYLPRSKRVLTFAASASGGPPDGNAEPLRDQEWVGPACGPYHYLTFMPVPGNAMPKAPVQDLLDLHHSVNSGYRKLIDQMLRQKSVLGVRGGAVDDAKRLKQASDGEMFACDNADSLKETRYGGPDPVNAQFAVHLSDVFNKLAGNLDLLAGSAPQSKTATQDKLLAENAGAGVQDMQEATVAGTAKVLDALGWFWWYHPQEVMETSYSVPGLADVSIKRELHPAAFEPDAPKKTLRRVGRYEDLRCRVDPYSLVFRTPQQRLQFLMSLVEKFAPLLPLLQQSGVQLDMQYLIKKIAEYADEPDVTGLFTVAEPPPAAAATQGGGLDPGMPSSTTREYVRHSQGQNTQAQRGTDMQNTAAQFAAAGDGGDQ